MASSVYIVEAQNGLVRFSHSTDPHARFAALRALSPIPLRLYSMWPGPRSEAADLRARFARMACHGDWLRPFGSLLWFMEQRRGNGLTCLEEWGEIRPTNREAVKANSVAARREVMRARWSDPAFRIEMLVRLGVGRALAKEFGPDYWRNRDPEFVARRMAVESRAETEIREREALRADAGRRPWLPPIIEAVASVSAIAVPTWVPHDLTEDYLDVADMEGEEAAASHVRRLKREAAAAISIAEPRRPA
ncbi:hypothetical protein AX289_29970 [Methylorubrum populi]|nr:hypothetical protein AX289_29970 [Methylorubrum populi]